MFAQAKKLNKYHRTAVRGETFTHAIYCFVLFFEGHGAYAVVGGVVGVFIVLASITASGSGE